MQQGVGRGKVESAHKDMISSLCIGRDVVRIIDLDKSRPAQIEAKRERCDGGKDLAEEGPGRLR